MWCEMASFIKKLPKRELSKFNGSGPPSKETWWWNEEVQKAIKTERDCLNLFIYIYFFVAVRIAKFFDKESKNRS